MVGGLITGFDLHVHKLLMFIIINVHLFESTFQISDFFENVFIGTY